VHDFCPRCRTERIGAFRYCLSCRFDFDTPGANTGAPLSGRSLAADVELRPLATTRERRFPARGLLALAFAVAVGVTGLSTDAMSNSGLPSSAFSSATATPQTGKQVAAAPAATPPVTRSATTNLLAGPSGKTTLARVVRAVDGDTILVTFGGKRYVVRYLGMDTPATVVRRASAANNALVAGKTVILEAGASDTDRSGRLLRYVWLHDGPTWTLVSLELVRRGFATVATHSPDRKYADAFLAAEREARARHLGFWGLAPKAKPTPRATAKPSKA
jgi:endonuclease YncB( thermonuclease family)